MPRDEHLTWWERDQIERRKWEALRRFEQRARRKDFWVTWGGLGLIIVSLAVMVWLGGS